MFYLPDALNYLLCVTNQARVQRTVFSPLKVTQSCPCTCHETTGGSGGTAPLILNPGTWGVNGQIRTPLALLPGTH